MGYSPDPDSVCSATLSEHRGAATPDNTLSGCKEVESPCLAYGPRSACRDTHTHTLHRQWVVTCWMVTGSCHSVLSIRDTNAKGRVGNKREQHPASPLCVKGDISRGQLEKDSRGWRQVAHNFVMRLNVSLFFRTKHFCTLDFCVHSTTDVSQRHPPPQ